MVDGAEGLPSVEWDGAAADAGFTGIKIDDDDIINSVIIKVKPSLRPERICSSKNVPVEWRPVILYDRLG